MHKYLVVYTSGYNCFYNYWTEAPNKDEATDYWSKYIDHDGSESPAIVNIIRLDEE